MFLPSSLARRASDSGNPAQFQTFAFAKTDRSYYFPMSKGSKGQKQIRLLVLDGA